MHCKMNVQRILLSWKEEFVQVGWLADFHPMLEIYEPIDLGDGRSYQLRYAKTYGASFWRPELEEMEPRLGELDSKPGGVGIYAEWLKRQCFKVGDQDLRIADASIRGLGVSRFLFNEITFSYSSAVGTKQ